MERGSERSGVAAAIAAVLGGVGAGGVIAAMGMGALSALSAACIGGTVNATVYQFNSNTISQFKYVWTFKAKNRNRKYLDLSE